MGVEWVIEEDGTELNCFSMKKQTEGYIKKTKTKKTATYRQRILQSQILPSRYSYYYYSKY
jgi:hypothetical protein